ncbi:glycosyltransferase family 21 protein [Cantharellus anzutake]|uniref:glycosyltransferase family 21 protein n=1 Tax=Cantharellus anzutake TaxID=1750568 RepID=UPI0019033879|nr:glycosyltransferase family 21 protein [Cantharellus anzutake]KAF8344200.1 glycosyltransferase family 21 protein [Cantharellus anzutake]
MVLEATYTTWDFVRWSTLLLASGWYGAFWGISMLGWSVARAVYTRRPRSPLASARPDTPVPGVSIIRPLRGLDPNLYENLESSLRQEYPNFEVIFAVQDPDDQALKVVRDLIANYPSVPTQIIVGNEVVGSNPKVNNLVRSFQQARHNIIWILDSNVCTESGTLTRSVDALTRPSPRSGSLPTTVQPTRRSRVGVVHHVPFAMTYGASQSLGSRIEEAFLNTTHAKMYIAINYLAIESCVMGKSNMYRRSDIERLTALPSSRGQYKRQRITDTGEPEPPIYPPEIITGLPAFGEFLAEDNMIAASMMHELGLSHGMSCDVAINALGPMSVYDYIERRVRWIRVRKHMVLTATLLEPFTECLALLFIGWYVISVSGIVPFWAFALVHIGGWLALDLGVYAAVAGHPLPASKRFAFLFAWLLRELMAFPIWLYGVLGSDVVWRGQTYTVRRNGKVRRREQDSAKYLPGRTLLGVVFP